MTTFQQIVTRATHPHLAPIIEPRRAPVHDPDGPYAVGDIVLELARLCEGGKTVQCCERIGTTGSWRIHYGAGRELGVTYDRHVVRRPADWEDAPEPHLTAVRLLELSTDGMIDRDDMREAQATDAAEAGEGTEWLKRWNAWYVRHAEPLLRR